MLNFEDFKLSQSIKHSSSTQAKYLLQFDESIHAQRIPKVPRIELNPISCRSSYGSGFIVIHIECQSSSSLSKSQLSKSLLSYSSVISPVSQFVDSVHRSEVVCCSLKTYQSSTGLLPCTIKTHSCFSKSTQSSLNLIEYVKMYPKILMKTSVHIFMSVASARLGGRAGNSRCANCFCSLQMNIAYGYEQFREISIPLFNFANKSNVTYPQSEHISL